MRAQGRSGLDALSPGRVLDLSAVQTESRLLLGPQRLPTVELMRLRVRCRSDADGLARGIVVYWWAGGVPFRHPELIPVTSAGYVEVRVPGKTGWAAIALGASAGGVVAPRLGHMVELTTDDEILFRPGFLPVIERFAVFGPLLKRNYDAVQSGIPKAGGAL